MSSAVVLLIGCVAPATLEGLRGRFVAEARERGVFIRPDSVRLAFVERLEGAAGRCFYNRLPREVEISREVWEGASEATRQVLVFHELGHCWLGHREHDASGIMAAEPLGRDAFLGREARWLDGLFR